MFTSPSANNKNCLIVIGLSGKWNWGCYYSSEIVVVSLLESKTWWKLDKVNIRNILGVEEKKSK